MADKSTGMLFKFSKTAPQTSRHIFLFPLRFTSMGQ